MAAGTLGFTTLLISGLLAPYEPPHASYRLRSRRLSRRMAEQASLKTQGKTQALNRLPKKHAVDPPLTQSLQLLLQPIHI